MRVAAPPPGLGPAALAAIVARVAAGSVAGRDPRSAAAAFAAEAERGVLHVAGSGYGRLDDGRIDVDDLVEAAIARCRSTR